MSRRASIGASVMILCLAAPACGGGSRVSVRPAAHTVAATGHPAPARRRAPAAAHASSDCNRHPPPERRLVGRQWLSGVIVTEYYPVPERWFNGALVQTPGVPGRHRVDWLYSANGVSMEGDGVDLAGQDLHIADLGEVGWVNAAGRSTVPPRCGVRWSAGPPDWRAGGWRDRAGRVTYPLAGGSWSDGVGHWVGDYGGTTFALGPSLPLRYYRSVAVDPRLIPLGSRIYIPAYRHINGGWFLAQDTGGAIIGRHLDVYRPPTRQPFGSGRLLLHAHAYVIPPGA